jgi:subtilisin family serine protease
MARRKSHQPAGKLGKTRCKFDPYLNFVLNQGVRRIRSQLRSEYQLFRTEIVRVEDISRKAAAEKSVRKRTELEEQAISLLEGLPNSLFHSVYFPDDKVLRAAVPPQVEFHTPFISGFIKGQFNDEDLGKIGIRVRQRAGDICTAFIPLEILPSLEKMAGIECIELSRPMRLDLNNSLPYSQISTLQGGPLNLTGNGVVVGVIDTFLNFYHPDFRNNDGAGGDTQGSTRVQFLWDQLLAPQAGEAGPPVLAGFPLTWATYGVEYSQANINADLNAYQPPAAPGQPPAANAYTVVRHNSPAVNITSGHGTHVTGIAAGNGRAQGGTFTGCAPGAGIIFVRNGSSNYIHGDSAQVADAFGYIFARAGVPCVVNMSQSDNMGSHDGTTLGEQFLDGLLATPGRAITLAAGNANNRGSHINGNVPQGGNTVVTVAYANDAFGNVPQSNDSIEIWYDGHDSFNVTLTVPGGSAASPAAATTVIGPIAPGTTSALTTLANNVQVQIVHGQNDARNNDNVITIFISNVTAAQPIPLGNWTIQLAGAAVINGAFEGWIDRNNRGRRAWTAPVENQGTLAVPACSLRAISVGNHDRTAPLPNIRATSSCGPTRDGRIKPDISAVGTNVNAPWYQLINTAAPGNFYNSIGGTSMAAPMVAGTVALMFQCRGAGLAWSDIKQLLQDNAAAPAVGIPSNTFGFGYLQAANLCAGPVPAVDIWLRDHSTDAGVEPFTGSVAWLSPDIEVLDMAGNPVSNPTHDPNNFVNNLVRVTVRNRGTVTARNVEVNLYWADPATNLPFPAEWKPDGIYTGDPNFVVQGNKLVISQLAAGAVTSVRYAWAPPAPGSNIRGDDHFCLIVRLEHEDDPSNIGAGGWAIIKGSNNIALRNTHVQEVPGGSGDSDTAFFVNGSNDVDTLEIEAENVTARIELQFPIQALPWRDLSLINKLGVPRKPYGAECAGDPLLQRKESVKGRNVALFTGFQGVREIRFSGGIARLIGDNRTAMTLSDIRVQPGVKMPVRLKVVGAKIGRGAGFVHVRQRSSGKILGGISLELVRRLRKGRKLKTYLEDGRLIIR